MGVRISSRTGSHLIEKQLTCPNLGQDVELKPLNSFLQGQWNQLNNVPRQRWLCAEPGDDYDERIHVMGNLVVPACGQLAGSILHSMGA